MRGEKQGVATSLVNLADDQLKLGELSAAERNLRRSIVLFREIEDEDSRGTGEFELARTMSYRGVFGEAQALLEVAPGVNVGHVQAQGVIWLYRALRSTLMGDAREGLYAARRARRLADDTARRSGCWVGRGWRWRMTRRESGRSICGRRRGI